MIILIDQIEKATKEDIKWAKREDEIKRPGLKSSNKPELVISEHSKIQSQSFANDSARVWNMASVNIKESKTLCAARRHIKTFVKTLPI